MTKEEQKAVEEFTEMNLTKKGLYHYNDMQDAFLIGLFKGEKMQLSLPSNLDEAAEKYTDDSLNNLGAILRVNVSNAFKAGAGWMAGRGVTVDGIITKVGYKLDAKLLNTYYQKNLNLKEVTR